MNVLALGRIFRKIVEPRGGVTRRTALTTTLPGTSKEHVMAESDSIGTIEYRPIPSFPVWYRVGRDATIWSCLNRRGRPGFGVRWKPCDVWTQHKLRLVEGYLVCFVRGLDGRKVRLPVHHAMLLAFVGPRPEGLWGLHKNDIRTDNRPENLYWGTPSQNVADCIRNGHFVNWERPTGESHWASVLTDEIVAEIRRLNAEGWTHRRLGRKFGIAHSTVGRVARRECWSHVP